MELQGDPNEVRREPQVSQGTFKNNTCGTGSNSEGKGGLLTPSLAPFLLNIDKIPMPKIKKKLSPTNTEFDAKGVPNWSSNRYQNSSTNNAKTGNGKDHEHHQK